MPVVDFILNTLGVIENVFSAAIVTILTYMIFGGWKFVFRAVSFFFDTQLVKLIGTVFSYFNKLITMDMFNEELTNALMKNIYVFIGVIMFFRLMMLVIKYLINPDLVGDNKAGINSLIQRVVLGCCGILFIPTIFNLANDLQVAILEDGIIQQLIIPHNMIDAMEDKINQGGHYIGTYVLAGFLSPNSSASSADVKQFELGVQQGDLSNIDINEGGFLTQKFKYDYFFFISTLALGYVFYYMLKYCIDIAGRCFKLLLYKMLTPIAMIEYIINGSQDGVFKQWLTATISTYCMLFVRILAIWFVLLVTTLMGDNSSGYAGTLLTENDYFLRAIIIIALLGFMMDLPKLVGQIFGLDLEQEGSASGVLKQVGGMVKGAAIGGLAVGGAAAAGGFSMAKGGMEALQKAGHEAGGLKNLAKNTGNNIKDKLSEAGKNIKNDPKGALKSATPGNLMRKANQLTGKMNESVFGDKLNATSGAILGAALGANQFTKAAYGGYKDEQQDEKSSKAKRKEAKERDEDVKRQETLIAGQNKIAENQEREARENVVRDVTERVVETMPQGTDAKDIKANVIAQMYGVPDQMTAQVSGQLTAITNSGGTVDAGTVTQTVQQVLAQRMDIAPQEVEQRVNQVLANGGSLATPAAVDQVVKQVIDSTVGERVQAEEQTITQVVNQVYGTRVNNAVDDATQTINQKLGEVASNTEATASAVVQQVDIQRDIRTNTEETSVWTELSAENTERSANSLGNIERDTHSLDGKV